MNKETYLEEEQTQITIKKSREDGHIPGFKIEIPSINQDGSINIKAAEKVIITPGETKIIPTGLIIELPEDYYIEIYPSLENELYTPLRVSSIKAEVINEYRPKEEYNKELGIIIQNTSQKLYTIQPKVTPKGERFYRKEDKHYPTYRISDVIYTKEGEQSAIYQINPGDVVAKIYIRKKEKIKIKEGICRTKRKNNYYEEN